MGSSLLAMSWGLEKTGLFPGIFIILFMGALCLYTSYLLLKVNEDHGKNNNKLFVDIFNRKIVCLLGLMGQNLEVPDLCRMLLGKWAEVIAKVFSLVVLIGANIVYWILMSNFLYNSVLFLYSKLGCLFCVRKLVFFVCRIQRIYRVEYMKFPIKTAQ